MCLQLFVNTATDTDRLVYPAVILCLAVCYCLLPSPLQPWTCPDHRLIILFSLHFTTCMQVSEVCGQKQPETLHDLHDFDMVRGSSLSDASFISRDVLLFPFSDVLEALLLQVNHGRPMLKKVLVKSKT